MRSYFTNCSTCGETVPADRLCVVFFKGDIRNSFFWFICDNGHRTCSDPGMVSLHALLILRLEGADFLYAPLEASEARPDTPMSSDDLLDLMVALDGTDLLAELAEPKEIPAE